MSIYDSADYFRLIDAIRQAPDDDLPRLVAADWLEEHGESDRAEFVRVQVERAGLKCMWDQTKTPRCFKLEGLCSGCERREVLKANEERLLKGPKPDIYENEVVWFNQGDGTDNWRYKFRPQWSRGFVENIRDRGADWIQHHAEIVRRNPVRKVTLGLGWVPDENRWREMVSNRWPGIEFTFEREPQPTERGDAFMNVVRQIEATFAAVRDIS